MIKNITPAEAGREMEYDCWINSKMPMAHVSVTLDVTRLVRCSKKRNIPMNAVLCYCIGKAAMQVKECHLLIKGKDILWSDTINVQTILKDKKGSLRFCDLRITETLEDYISNYYSVKKEVYETCQHHFEQDAIFIGTSCLSTKICIDSAVNQYNDIYQNIFLMWGAFRRSLLWRYKLPISMQFHHVQINGGEVCHFFEILQSEINKVGSIN